ncbi:MAG: hypothetical protein LT102_08455 [Burkholderiaceae bacterium]|nr:hypothetical protein [Burkholderiaceae bacterium]
MISELVWFDLPSGMPREEVVEGMRAVAPRWRADGQLIRKTFLYDAANARTGALYLWKTKAAADAAHDDTWLEGVRTKYGSTPTRQFFETPLIVDNALGQTIEEEPGRRSSAE